MRMCKDSKRNAHSNKVTGTIFGVPTRRTDTYDQLNYVLSDKEWFREDPGNKNKIRVHDL